MAISEILCGIQNWAISGDISCIAKSDSMTYYLDLYGCMCSQCWQLPGRRRCVRMRNVGDSAHARSACQHGRVRVVEVAVHAVLVRLEQLE